MPSIPDALALAVQHHQAGRLPAAEQIYRQILQTEPNQPDALHLLGMIAHRVGQHEVAVEYIERAIALHGSAPDYHNNLGKVYHTLRRPPEAVASYRRALELEPDFAEAHNNLGVALKAQGMLAEAVAAGRRALELRPDFAEAHNNLGLALKQQGKPAEAVACHRRAIELKPDLAEAHNNLGLALTRLRRLEEAVACHRRAVELKPDLAEAHNNLGDALTEQGDLGEAIACFQRALELNPRFLEAHNNLAVAYKEQGNLEEAKACIRRALELEPNHAEAHTNLGMFLLLAGQYRDGWREYERRLDCATTVPRKLSERRWQGEPAEGGTILLRGEQGFGDMLQFIRYAPLVRERTGAQVMIETQPALARLFAQNLPDAKIVPGLHVEAESLPPCDFQIPVLSLPFALNLPDPLPRPGGYLRPDPALRHAWRSRLGRASALRVGLVWAGNAAHKLDRLRSISPEKLLPLLQTPGREFYSLQIGPRHPEARPFGAVGLIDLTAHLTDFADTAAFVAELDLIICVDTAVAHLAGALGRPVWTLLPFAPDWRWGLASEATPWYPTMRLFRQPSRGDWDTVLRRITVELEQTTGEQRESNDKL